MQSYKVVKPEELDYLKPLIGEFIVELNMSHETSVDYIINNMKATLTRGQSVIMSDNITNPTMFFFGTCHSSVVSRIKFFLVSIIYIRKQNRGNSKNVVTLTNSIESAAKITGCDKIVGGQYEKLPFSKAGEMWLKSGYEKRQTQFVKEL